MPRKKLKVKDTGAGDPTFALIIQFENTDGDSETSITLESIEATMQAEEDKAGQPVLDLGETTFPIGENDNILILSSFSYESDDPPLEGSIIPVSTTIAFTPPGILEIEDDTSDPSLGGEVDDRKGTITYQSGIAAIPARTTSLPNQNLQSLTVSMQAIARDSDNQGNQVFLEGTDSDFFASTSFVSTNDQAIWLIAYHIEGGFYTIRNKGNNKLLGSSGGNSSALAWYDDTEAPAEAKWYISINERYTYNFQNAYATYLTADTTSANGDIRMSKVSTPWYLHPIDEILGNY